MTGCTHAMFSTVNVDANDANHGADYGYCPDCVNRCWVYSDATPPENCQKRDGFTLYALDNATVDDVRIFLVG